MTALTDDARQPGAGVLLTLCCALTFTAQLGTSLFLPALPALADEHGLSAGSAGLIVVMLALGAALPLPFFGAAADCYGRKRLLIGSLLLFIAASLLLTVAAQAELFLLMRFLQGVGAGGAAVTSRILIRDVSDSRVLAKNLSYLSFAFIFSLGSGQFVGGLIQQHFSWRVTAYLLCLVGVALLGLALRLRFPPEPPPSSGSAFGDYPALLSNSRFLRPLLVGALGYGALLLMQQSAPYLFQKQLGLSPAQYGNLGVAISLAYLAGALLVNRISVRAGARRLMLMGLAVMLVASCLLLFLSRDSLLHPGLLLVLGLFVLAYCAVSFGQALIFPNSMASALASASRGSGQATALCAFLQQIVGAGIAFLPALLSHHISLVAGAVLLLSIGGVLLLGPARQQS
ncbi:MFS transporter [Massilia sp. YIM B04103]|uniref:MFS transporter n=1 Tax=Massilia sp. YIM B04103 TaxID=2963106 RepID=UPI00210B9EC1|nr:MFS transporter [Massilia sp. YIM B04103]